MPALNFSPFPQLATERLLLRRLNKTDAHDIMMLRSDEQVNKFLDRPACIDLEDAENFIAGIEKGINNNESLYWVITLKENDKLIGTICLWNFELEKMQAEVGFALLPGFQGKGFMLEAILKIIEFSFSELKLSVLTGLTHPANIRSIKVLESSNFIRDMNYKLVSKEDAGNLVVFYLQAPGK